MNTVDNNYIITNVTDCQWVQTLNQKTEAYSEATLLKVSEGGHYSPPRVFNAHIGTANENTHGRRTTYRNFH